MVDDLDSDKSDLDSDTAVSEKTSGSEHKYSWRTLVDCDNDDSSIPFLGL